MKMRSNISEKMALVKIFDILILIDTDISQEFLCTYLMLHSLSAGFSVMHMSILYLIMGDQP